MTRDEVLARLDRALAELLPIRGQLDGTVPEELAFAMGELGGVCMRLKMILEDVIDREATRQ